MSYTLLKRRTGANEKTAAIIAARKPSQSAKQTKSAEDPFPFN